MRSRLYLAWQEMKGQAVVGMEVLRVYQRVAYVYD